MSQSTKFDAAGYVEADKAHVWHHLLQHQAIAAKGPMIVTEAKGLRIKDINGREFLDATSGGVWCVNVGYGRERIANAVCEQLKKMPYYAGTAGNIPHIEYAAKLIGYMPGLSRVYLSNSGSEANEKAFKMIRSLAHIKGNVEKKKIIFRNRDYHGTTIAALSATGQPERKEWFGPFVPGFVEFPHACCYRCAFNKTYPGCNIECARALETVILEEGPDTVGGVIVEPITAGGGVIPPVPEYYPILQEICRKYDVLMIMDEVVCGVGRTGKMFGYQNYEVKPDIVTMAKGVASAYMPISVTVTPRKSSLLPARPVRPHVLFPRYQHLRRLRRGLHGGHREPEHHRGRESPRERDEHGPVSPRRPARPARTAQCRRRARPGPVLRRGDGRGQRSPGSRPGRERSFQSPGPNEMAADGVWLDAPTEASRA
jgi:taurine-pyruvate aminotransferase